MTTNALTYAAIYNDADTVRKLLAAGTDPNQNNGEAIITAVLHNSGHVIDELLNNCATDAALDRFKAFTFAFHIGRDGILGDLLVWHMEKYGHEKSMALANTLLEHGKYLPGSVTIVHEFIAAFTEPGPRRSDRARKRTKHSTICDRCGNYHDSLDMACI